MRLVHAALGAGASGPVLRVPSRGKQTAAAAAQGPTASSIWSMARRATLCGAGAGAALLVGEMLYVRAKFRLPPDARGPLAGVEQPTAVSSAAAGRGWLRSADPPPRQLNIVFLGDSLVTGVGCSAEASEARGPVLPRRVAELLAQQLGASVAWSCGGETGADVSMLRTRLLPILQSEIKRVAASGEGQRVDAVIVMTGLNDIKECLLFANPRLHPWRFGELMESLLCSVHEMAGSPSTLLVAGCPIEAVPRFNDLWPMSAATRAITRLWEDQKRRAAEAAHARELATGTAGGKIAFVAPPSSLVQRLLDGVPYFSSDGMHPNDAGYVVWAELLASELLATWKVSGLPPAAA